MQLRLEDKFATGMAELKSQMKSAGPAKETVAKVAEDLRTFRTLMYSMLGLLRSQISACVKEFEDAETRKRRKALLFHGIKENDGEDCYAIVLNILKNKLSLEHFTPASLKACHRLGLSKSENRHRPILVRFGAVADRSSVWRAKKGLKGSSISVKEFLTRRRQEVFGKARLHFGVQSCWTQDGVIVVKPLDGSKHRITSMDELKPLLSKYPKAPGDGLYFIIFCVGGWYSNKITLQPTILYCKQRRYIHFYIRFSFAVYLHNIIKIT